MSVVSSANPSERNIRAFRYHVSLLTVVSNGVSLANLHDCSRSNCTKAACPLSVLAGLGAGDRAGGLSTERNTLDVHVDWRIAPSLLACETVVFVSVLKAPLLRSLQSMTRYRGSVSAEVPTKLVVKQEITRHWRVIMAFLSFEAHQVRLCVWAELLPVSRPSHPKLMSPSYLQFLFSSS
jgi:hypothetical protein